MNKFFITAAIPYVNASPHIGHAQEFVLSDTIRRYQLSKNKDVLFLCGADENGLKIVQAAENSKMSPIEFCDIHQKEFLKLADLLNVKFDVWQRGTNKTHIVSSQKLWERCFANGDIYKKRYSGLYCVGCEAFYTKDELNSDGECFEHPGKKLQEVSEENYFFALSKYQDFIVDLIENDKLKIYPQIRKNEALSFVKKGLEDFSISRSVERAKGWGVPVPSDPSQIMYVWFDALNVYQSGIGFGWEDEKYQKWQPQDLMVIGKGILRFHAIYWPAILQSAKLNLPKKLFVHGYMTVNGQKMSKTLGNVVDPIQMINKYSADALRYYLSKEIPSFSDGDFSENRFVELYNSDLANGLGNLVSRVAKLCERNDVSGLNINDLKTGSRSVDEYMESYQLNFAIEEIWKEIKATDLLIDQDKPWTLSGNIAKEKLLVYSERILYIAKLLLPFLPIISQEIINQYTADKIVSKQPLFPRLVK